MVALWVGVRRVLPGFSYLCIFSPLLGAGIDAGPTFVFEFGLIVRLSCYFMQKTSSKSGSLLIYNY